MKAPVSSHDIRENLKKALNQLELLQEQGRIVMAEDRLDNDWPDSTAAVTAALAGLELADDATYGMQTLPNDAGDCPTNRTCQAKVDHDARKLYESSAMSTSSGY